MKERIPRNIIVEFEEDRDWIKTRKKKKIELKKNKINLYNVL